MITRWLCRLGLHLFEVHHNGRRFVSQCRWCRRFERGHAP